MQRALLQTLRAWPLPSPAACSPSRRYYASARSSRVPPTAFDPIGFDDDEPSLKPTPPKDVKAEKRAWRAAAAAEKEVLAQARLERLTEEVERGRRRKVGDWEAHEREQARAREEQLKSLAASEREDKRRRTVEKVLAAKAAKAKRAADRLAQEQARMRLEEQMQRAAYELYGSRRRTSANAPAKVHDHDSHYVALGLAPGTLAAIPTDDEVKDAWRKRMREVHPDVPGGSTEKASRVNQAFAALETDLGRRAYQRKGLVLNGVGGIYR